MRIARASVTTTFIALACAAGCASAGAPVPRIETQSVTVTEPPASPAPTVPVAEPSVPQESAGDALLLAMTHMVANDGTTRPLAWHRLPALRDLGCASSSARGAGGPLYEPGVYGALDPRAGLRWRDGLWLGVGVGIGFGDDDVEPMVYAWPCSGAYTEGTATSRIARLAPEIAGRDTSHLFTRERARMGMGRSAGPADVLGTVVGAVTGRTPAESAPRTAKPRPAAVPAATAAAPAKSETPKGEAPEESSGNSRKGGILGDMIRGASSSGGSRTHQ